MRCATVLVVRVLANGCSELAHPRKLFCCAGFQPAILALSEMLAALLCQGKQDAGAISNIATPLRREWLPKESAPAKAECAPAASRATSGAGVLGASVAGFRRRCREDRRERDARPAASDGATRRRRFSRALDRRGAGVARLALRGTRGPRRSRKAAAACFLLRSAKQFREPSQRQRLRPR